MTKEEFESWKAYTAASAHRWQEDAIFRLNGKGLFYYTGGEDGMYIEIRKDGALEVGTYEGALPHIGEAMFTTKAERQCANFDEAFQTACGLGGQGFMADMFSQDHTMPKCEMEFLC